MLGLLTAMLTVGAQTAAEVGGLADDAPASPEARHAAFDEASRKISFTFVLGDDLRFNAFAVRAEDDAWRIDDTEVSFRLRVLAQEPATVFYLRAQTGEEAQAADHAPAYLLAVGGEPAIFGDADAVEMEIEILEDGSVALRVAHAPPAGIGEEAADVSPRRRVGDPMARTAGADVAALPHVPIYDASLLWFVALIAAAALGVGAVLAYTRITRARVLDHPRRRSIMDIVNARPGIGARTLRTMTEMAVGSFQHHVRSLEQARLLRIVRDGRSVRLWPPGPRLSARERMAPRRSRILAALQSSPWLSTPQVAEAVGVRVQTARAHLLRMQRSGLVQATMKKRATCWTVCA